MLILGAVKWLLWGLLSIAPAPAPPVAIAQPAIGAPCDRGAGIDAPGGGV